MCHPWTNYSVRTNSEPKTFQEQNCLSVLTIHLVLLLFLCKREDLIETISNSTAIIRFLKSFPGKWGCDEGATRAHCSLEKTVPKYRLIVLNKFHKNLWHKFGFFTGLLSHSILISKKHIGVIELSQHTPNFWVKVVHSHKGLILQLQLRQIQSNQKLTTMLDHL